MTVKATSSKVQQRHLRMNHEGQKPFWRLVGLPASGVPPPYRVSVRRGSRAVLGDARGGSRAVLGGSGYGPQRSTGRRLRPALRRFECRLDARHMNLCSCTFLDVRPDVSFMRRKSVRRKSLSGNWVRLYVRLYVGSRAGKAGQIITRWNLSCGQSGWMQVGKGGN